MFWYIYTIIMSACWQDLFILNTEPDYPQNYLIINDTGVHLAGVDTEFNHALPVTARPPLAVDTINRFVYWYDESPRSIARHSLNNGDVDIRVRLTLDLYMYMYTMS
jgi:hypothetical protein